jgi:Cys-tRNA(Pro)/Cys-tRNA(Cys) deacylase
MPTRAARFLEKKAISFDIVKYEHTEKGAAFAAKAIKFPLEKTVKTLVVDLGNKRYCLALVPGDKNLSLKKIAAFFSVKKPVMADPQTAERITGYLTGGISPFGTKMRIHAVMEKNLLDFEKIMINAGQRGIMLLMKPIDIVKALECKTTGIST